MWDEVSVADSNHITDTPEPQPAPIPQPAPLRSVESTSYATFWHGISSTGRVMLFTSVIVLLIVLATAVNVVIDTRKLSSPTNLCTYMSDNSL